MQADVVWRAEHADWYSILQHANQKNDEPPTLLMSGPLKLVRAEEHLLLVMGERLVCALQPGAPFVRLENGEPVAQLRCGAS